MLLRQGRMLEGEYLDFSSPILQMSDYLGFTDLAYLLA